MYVATLRSHRACDSPPFHVPCRLGCPPFFGGRMNARKTQHLSRSSVCVAGQPSPPRLSSCKAGTGPQRRLPPAPPPVPSPTSPPLLSTPLSPLPLPPPPPPAPPLPSPSSLSPTPRPAAPAPSCLCAPHLCGVAQRVSCNWLASLGVTSSRSLHTAACVRLAPFGLSSVPRLHAFASLGHARQTLGSLPRPSRRERGRTDAHGSLSPDPGVEGLVVTALTS